MFVPGVLGYNSEYIYYYIDKEGNIVRDTRDSGENTKAKTVSIKKISESELQEIETYILNNVDINNVEMDEDWESDPYLWRVEFEGETVSYSKELVSELMDMVDLTME